MAARTRRRLTDRPDFWGFLFITPWLIGFLLFTAGPMISSLWLSFQKYNLADSEWVGLENYRRLLWHDPLFWTALRNTLLYALFSVPLGIVGSLAIALLLNQKVRGIPVFRTLFYLPSLVPSVASAILWSWVFNADYGLLNMGLSWVGLPTPQWLQDERWTLPAFVLMSLWGVGGARMIIFLAGLQGISETYYEAARIDGATNAQQFRHVTLPLLSPVMFFNLVLGVIGSFQVFTQAYVMTGGGPNNASLFYALYLFRNAFEYFKLGKASAMAWILFAILLALTLIQFKTSKRWVHYEGGDA
ncbi:MAG: sugar ABC transporter permease [Fimbriimonadaceae bacterium]|nr:sugar ABC transporter permease [Fimbriimonadaceae bacterium]